MKATQALRMAVQAVLVELASEGELDGDINALDIDSVFEKAEELVKTQEFYTRMHRREVLYAEVLTGDSEQKMALIALDEAEDSTIASHILDVSEMYEDFTVAEIKNIIAP